MQSLSLTWKGEQLEFKPTHELFRAIETEVSINRIADTMDRARRGNVVDLPLSHVSWVLYCCLRHAGAAGVRTPMDVHHALMAHEVQYEGVLSGLIVAYWGPQPQKPPKKKSQASRTGRAGSRRSGSTSRNATAPPSASGE